MSEEDSVISPDGVLNLFTQRFTHPDSRMIWYGKKPQVNEPRIRSQPTFLPEENISNFAHMSALFSPDNAFFGKEGEHRICRNGQTEEKAAQCLTADTVWYSAWGYKEDNKIHARLTWNPYYNTMIDEMTDVLLSASSAKGEHPIKINNRY